MRTKCLLVNVLFLIASGVLAQTPYLEIDNAVRGTGNNQFNYVGAGWTHAISNFDPYLNNTLSYSKVVNDYVTVKFQGNRIQLFTRRADHHGIAGVSIDNGPETMVDMVRTDRQPPASFVLVFDSQFSNVKEGAHTVKIRVTGQKNARATDTYVVIDYVRVFTSQNLNTTLGHQSLASNTSGLFNTAFGLKTLNANTDGYANAGFGSYALEKNTVGYENTAVGDQALKTNDAGAANTAVGFLTLRDNTSGASNTAVGHSALSENTWGWGNTAAGAAALSSNDTGSENVALGASALRVNSSGSNNTAVGTNVLSWNSDGGHNTAVGTDALSHIRGHGNTAVGSAAMENNSVGNYNTVIGIYAGTLYYGTIGPRPPVPEFNNTTAIGAWATVTASNQVRIGNSDVTSIGGQVSWSTLSDGRFKKDVKEDVSGLEFIKQLRPVSYTVDKAAVDKFLGIPDSLRRLNDQSRQKSERQSGFVAQEVDALVKKTGYVFHGVEAPKTANEHYSIRYAEFVVPLVKAMQELAEKVEAQQSTISEQQSKIKSLVGQLKKIGIETEDVMSTGVIELYQNNPNPFTSNTEIKMSLPESAMNARVIVYTLEGKQLKDVLVRERGETSVVIEASELHAGMYLYALIVDGEVMDTKRMILTK